MYYDQPDHYDIVEEPDGTFVRTDSTGTILGYATLKDLYCDEYDFDPDLDLDDVSDYVAWITEEADLSLDQIGNLSECPDTWRGVFSGSSLADALNSLFSAYSTVNDYRFAEWLSCFYIRSCGESIALADLLPADSRSMLSTFNKNIFFDLFQGSAYCPSISIYLNDAGEPLAVFEMDELSADTWDVRIAESIVEESASNMFNPYADEEPEDFFKEALIILASHYNDYAIAMLSDHFSQYDIPSLVEAYRMGVPIEDLFV